MDNKKLPTKVTTTLFGVEVSGYRTSDGEWVMGIRDVSRMVNKSPSSLSDFLKSKWLKARLGEGLSCPNIYVPNSPPIKSVPLKVITQYIKKLVIGGDELAEKIFDGLAEYSLESRFESLLSKNEETKELSNSLAKKYLDVKSERQYQKQLGVQHTFQLWCQAKRLNPAIVHNYITQKVVGRTAKQSRLLPLNSGFKEDVGLDHYQEDESEEMNLITQVKKELPLSFHFKKKGYGYKNYVDDVIDKLTL